MGGDVCVPGTSLPGKNVAFLFLNSSIALFIASSQSFLSWTVLRKKRTEKLFPTLLAYLALSVQLLTELVIENSAW